MINELVQSTIGNWLLNEDVGLSSKCIAGVLLGGMPQTPSHPFDPSDFRRCKTLIDLLPQGENWIERMRGISPQWDVIIEHWAELCALYQEEHEQHQAPRLYAYMKELGL